MSVHVPILVEPIVEALVGALEAAASREPLWCVDCTLGGGGHTQALLAAIQSRPTMKHHRLLSMDQDPAAIAHAQQRFKDEIQQGRLTVAHTRMGSSTPHLEGKKIFALMADLGFSSDQIESPERGLSFMKDGPLDMRLNPTAGKTAWEFLKDVSEKNLTLILEEWGEERYSRKIAHAIVSARSHGTLLNSTRGLAELVRSAMPPAERNGRIHPATRTFQAIRIEVNQELEELDLLLEKIIPHVEKGGRVAILSFHSLEDRKVKQRFLPAQKAHINKYRPESAQAIQTHADLPLSDGVAFRSLHKKPIEADDEEIRRNPRARSAKLRIAERIF